MKIDLEEEKICIVNNNDNNVNNAALGHDNS